MSVCSLQQTCNRSIHSYRGSTKQRVHPTIQREDGNNFVLWLQRQKVRTKVISRHALQSKCMHKQQHTHAPPSCYGVRVPDVRIWTWTPANMNGRNVDCRECTFDTNRRPPIRMDVTQTQEDVRGHTWTSVDATRHPWTPDDNNEWADRQHVHGLSRMYTQ